MKKIALLLLILLPSTIQAQQAPGSILLEAKVDKQFSYDGGFTPSKIILGNQEKTRGISRWYDIVDAADKDLGSSINIYQHLHTSFLWEDSTMLVLFGSTYSGAWAKSIENYIDPVDPRFNNPTHYSGETEITNSNPFTIDSLFIPFTYSRNLTKTSIVDTLIVSVIYGIGNGIGYDLDTLYGTSPSWQMNYNTDTLFFMQSFTDLNPTSPNYHGYIASTPARVRTIKVPLTAASLSDTTSQGFNYIQVPINLNVPAGYKAAASMAFISGDTWTPNMDTLFTAGNKETPNFNYVQFYGYYEKSSGFQKYTKRIWTQSGIMHTDTSWGNQHVPCFSYSNPFFEHQWFQWKLTCPTCWSVSARNLSSPLESLNIFPNPTTKSTTLSLETSKPIHNAEIQLLDLNGRVLSTSKIGFIPGNGVYQKEISVDEIASGIYLIKLTANEGQRVEKLVIE